MVKSAAKPSVKYMPNTSSVNKLKKVKKTGKVIGKDAISLYSSGIFQVIKIKDVRILQQDIENHCVESARIWIFPGP